MWLLLVIGCDWFGGGPSAPPPADDVPPPPVEGPALPPPPRVGLAEVDPPASLVAPTAIEERYGPALVDVTVDPDVTTFDAMGAQLDAWGLTREDGDGRVWRVRGDAGPLLATRLAAAPGVATARDALTRLPMEDGAWAAGSARYGDTTFTWREVEGGAEQAFGAVKVKPPVLPRGLTGGVLSCLSPALDDLARGHVQGPGWSRLYAPEQGAWALGVDGYGFCDASGWVVLTAGAPIDGLRVGGRPAAEADATWLYDLAAQWVARPHASTDPMLDQAVALLGGAPDVVLARAMAGAGCVEAQRRLFQAFSARDEEAALAVAAGAPAPWLRAQAVGTDEELRKAALADPATPSEVLYAALAAWRPGADPALDERVRSSPSPRVRERAWELRLEAAPGPACGGPPPADRAGLEARYRDCPGAEARAATLKALRTTAPDAVKPLLAATLAAPETPATGVAAARAAASAGHLDLLVGVVGDIHVDRSVRGVALRELVRLGAPQAAALVTKHGAFLGVSPAGTGGAAVVDGGRGG